MRLRRDMHRAKGVFVHVSRDVGFFFPFKLFGQTTIPNPDLTRIPVTENCVSTISTIIVGLTKIHGSVLFQKYLARFLELACVNLIESMTHLASSCYCFIETQMVRHAPHKTLGRAQRPRCTLGLGGLIAPTCRWRSRKSKHPLCHASKCGSAGKTDAVGDGLA